MKLRHVLFNLDSKYQKNKLYADDESDIDDDWIVEHEESLKKKDIEKAEKKFAKDNEKLVEEGSQPQEDSLLKGRIAVIEEDYKRLAKERGAGKAVLKRERAVEKIEEAIQKLDERIKTFKLQMDDREAGKEVALGTRFVAFCISVLVSGFLTHHPKYSSKINYLDPR
jgi:DNA topoisomerase-1